MFVFVCWESQKQAALWDLVEITFFLMAQQDAIQFISFLFIYLCISHPAVLYKQQLFVTSHWFNTSHGFVVLFCFFSRRIFCITKFHSIRVKVCACSLINSCKVNTCHAGFIKEMHRLRYFYHEKIWGRACWFGIRTFSLSSQYSYSKKRKNGHHLQQFQLEYYSSRLANLFSSHHIRVESLGTVLTPFHFDVWPFKSGLKWVEPYKSKSSHYGNGVWEGGKWKSFLMLIINRCIMRKVEKQLLHSEQSKAYLQIISLTNLA